MEEQKCEKYIEQGISSNGSNINTGIVSVFRQVLKLGMALSMKIWDMI